MFSNKQNLNKILSQIVENTRQVIREKKKHVSVGELINRFDRFKLTDKFKVAIENPKKGGIALIAEIKFASPSNPTLSDRSGLLERAKKYEEAGADGISFITERSFFKGEVADIPELLKVATLPVLQKDFVIDEYQIYEAKSVGSDAILLIARLVEGQVLNKYVNLCRRLGVEPVVEIQSDEDFRKALSTNTSIIAVNARDLSTFEINVDNACNLLNKIPNNFIKLGFSGINSKHEVEKYKKAGATGVLVGTSLMQAENVREFIDGLRNI